MADTIGGRKTSAGRAPRKPETSDYADKHGDADIALPLRVSVLSRSRARLGPSCLLFLDQQVQL